MSIKAFRFHNSRRGAALSVKIIPDSSANRLVNILEDGTLAIELHASAVDEEVNTALIKFLELICRIPDHQIEIVAGEKGFEKLIAILDVDPELIQNRVIAFCNSSQQD